MNRARGICVTIKIIITHSPVGPTEAAVHQPRFDQERLLRFSYRPRFEGSRLIVPISRRLPRLGKITFSRLTRLRSICKMIRYVRMITYQTVIGRTWDYLPAACRRGGCRHKPQVGALRVGDEDDGRCPYVFCALSTLSTNRQARLS